MNIEEFMIIAGVVEFGNFTLKSGVKSNVFFNLGNLNSGWKLNRLGTLFAERIMKSNLNNNDFIFGPAYKGINISACISMALASLFAVEIPFYYDRKESKDHGELGKIIGPGISSKKSGIMVDDVFTDGKTKYEIIDYFKDAYPRIKFSSLLVVIDREELNDDGKKYSDIFTERTGIKVIPLTTKEKIMKLKAEEI